MQGRSDELFQLIMPELLESILLGSTGVPEPLVMMTDGVLYDTSPKVNCQAQAWKLSRLR